LLGIGIEADAACIGILAFSNLVRYRSIPVPVWVSLFRYRAGSSMEIFLIPVPGSSDAGQSGVPA
jgi:hypothetical protein